MPIFLLKNIKINSIRALSEGKHLKLTLKDNNNVINAIGFNLGNLSEEYQIGDSIDLIGALEINDFSGDENKSIKSRFISMTMRLLTARAKSILQRLNFGMQQSTDSF